MPARGCFPGQQFRTQLEHPHGWSLPAQWYAMICRRHMAEFGTSKEQLAAVALAAHRYAQANPRAMRYGRPLTLGVPDGRRSSPTRTSATTAAWRPTARAAVVVAAATAQAIDRGAGPAVLSVAVSARPQSPDDLTNRPDWYQIGLTQAAPRRLRGGIPGP